MHLSKRPAEANDRVVSGRDLAFGKRPSVVTTLGERSTRFVQLVALPDGGKAEQVRPALTTAVQRLPEALHRSLA